MGYVAGRSWIEYLRVDHANHILGLRLNDWTSIFVFTLALAAFIVSAVRRPGRESVVEFKTIDSDDDGRRPLAEASQPSGEHDSDDAQATLPEDRTPTEGATP